MAAPTPEPSLPAVPILRPSTSAWSSRFWASAVALTVAGFCIAAAMMLCDMRRDTRDRAVTAESNLLNALAQDIARNVELYDLSLRAVVDGLAEPGFADLSPRIQDLILYDRAATASDLGAMLVLDRAGKVMRGSEPGSIGTDLSDREYFQALRSDPGRGLFISKPFRRRVTGNDEVIALARALHTPEGAFAGVVVGTLRLAYLRELFAKADLGRRGAVNLFLLDGTCIMRVPYQATSIGRSLAGTVNFERFLKAPSGTFSGPSAVDGVQRLYSFAHVGHLPLVLDVALAEDDVLAPWRTKATVIGAALLSLCAMAAFLAHMRARSEAEHRLLAENAIDVVIRLDGALRRTYVSASCRAVLGYEPSELLGGNPRETVHPDDWSTVAAWFHGVRDGQPVGEAVFRMRRKDGTVLWMEGRCRSVPGATGYLVVLRDVSQRRAAQERAASLTAELARLAHSDGLTGLANRRRFDEALSGEWDRAEAGTAPLSLLLLDVDRFKVFNDRYGHQRGDACLQAVARAVADAVTRPDALVARYGGEEIAVVLPGVDAAGAATQAEQIRAGVELLALDHAGNQGGLVTVSVGCATRGEGTVDADALVATADARLYEAKRLGRNRVVAAQPSPRDAPRTAVEDERLAALSRCDASGAFAATDAFDRIADLAAHLFGTPAAFVSVVWENEVTLAGRHGVEAVSRPRDEVFCAQTVLGDGVLVVPDAAADPRLADLPMVREGCRFYAGAPFKDTAGDGNLGALCIVADAPRPALDATQRDVLVGLARLVTDELARCLIARGDGHGTAEDEAA